MKCLSLGAKKPLYMVICRSVLEYCICLRIINAVMEHRHGISPDVHVVLEHF